MKNNNTEECFGGMGCPGIFRVSPKEECGLWACPGVYEMVSGEKCGIGACPGVYQLAPKDKCGPIGGCPSVHEGIENDYLIIGSLVQNPKDFGLEKKVGKGEVLIRVPKKIIDDMKR